MILNYKDTGNGSVIVFLHGMAGSHRYWNGFLPYVSKDHRTITVDLLGFGQSPMPDDNKYDYASHINSIKDTLGHAGVNKPFILVGHSMGALIALRYAREFSEEIKKLALVSMPIYENPHDAHAAITKGSKLKELIYYGPTSRILCNLWCRKLRPISRRVAPRYLPHLTEESASDSVLHTWFSYSRSLKNIIENQNVVEDLNTVKRPTLLLYGASDTPSRINELKALADKPNITLMREEGTHQIIHERPARLSEWLVS